MKQTTCILFFALLALTSCNKEMDMGPEIIQSEKELLFTINIPAGATASSGEVTQYIITDKDGKIIDSHQFKNGDEEIKLFSDVAERHESFNYYLVSETERMMWVVGYIDLKKGDVMNHEAPNNYYNEQKTTAFKIKNFPDFDLLNYSTSRSTFNLYNLTDTTTLGTSFDYKADDKFYLQIIKGSKAFYNYYDIAPESGILTIDASKCITPAIRKVISLQKNGFSSYGEILGWSNRSNDDGQRVGLFESAQNKDATIFYPKGLASYTTRIYYFKNVEPGEEIIQAFGNYYQGSIPNSDVPIATTFSVLKNEVGDLNIDFTGSFKFYVASFGTYLPATQTNPKERSIYVTFFSPSSKEKLSLPDFSSLGINTLALQKIKLSTLNVYDYNCEKLYYFDYINRINVPKKYIEKGSSTQYLNANNTSSTLGHNSELSGFKNLHISRSGMPAMDKNIYKRP